jgi:choline dehydrogenase-like flavoprotein
MTTVTAAAPLLPEERRLRLLLRVLAAAFALAVLAYLLPALVGRLKPAWMQLPFVTNSVVKVGVLGLLAFVASGDVRRFRVLVLLLIWGHALSEVAMIACLLWADLSAPAWQARLGFSMTTTLYGAMALDGVILGLLIGAFASADRARYRLRYLAPLEFRALEALADVVLDGRDGQVFTAEEIAHNVDRYLGSFEAKRKWLTKLALTGLELYPLLSWQAPLSYLGHAERYLFVRRAMYQDVDRRLLPAWFRTLVQGMTRLGSQLVYLGYYNDPRTFPSVGYQVFLARPDTAQRLQDSPSPPRQPLHTMSPADVVQEELAADVIIVGTGAGGAILAHELVQAGCDVLMLERGRHVDPSQFTSDEVDMLGRLYQDGALQLSRDFRFQVLQGSCVGGTTVVNNAVSFRLPERVLELWNDPAQLDARIDAGAYRSAEDEVWRLMRVGGQDHRFLNPSGYPIHAAIQRLGFAQAPNRAGAVDANIAACLGCGYCNIGCAYGRKLSMLDHILPRAQAAGPGRLRILAGCEVTKFEGRGDRITAARCELSDGRVVKIRGRVFALAAGAVSSSLVLLRSGILSDRVGRGLCFNVGSPVSGVFPEPIRSYAGLQISHYLELAPSRGYVLESWYNPPVAQALTMPGWFEDHFENMRMYDRIGSIGVLVGSQANGRATTGGLTGREIQYTPTPGDLRKLLDGIVLAGKVLLEAGCQSVMPHTFRLRRYATVAELATFPGSIRDASDLTLGTGHPQGGNPISGRKDRGVVEPDFRVKGYANLFVSDASLFPSSVGVNPQITVMSLARYGSRFVRDVAARGGDR